MKLAFFSDIHANLPALEAGYSAAVKAGAVKFYSCGDNLGAGPFPAETVRFLTEKNFTSITGNLERKLLAGINASLKKKKFPADKKGNLAWTASRLDSAAVDWLRSLPASLFFTESGVRIKAVHGSPLSDVDYIYPSITAEGLTRYLDPDLPDILVCGHSHIPFAKKVSRVLVINCGSAGRPVDGDTAGSFAIVDINAKGGPTAKIIRFSYSMDTLIDELRRTEPPGVIIEEYLAAIKRKGA